MEVAIQLKRGIPDPGIFRIIISEISHRQEPYPVIMLVVDKGSEVDIYCTILSFSLAVNLGVKGG